MIRLVCVLIGYIFGLFQTAYLYGKCRGIDIRKHGSGNAGTTNALRTLGLKAGLLTFAGDCFKCFLAVLLVKALFGERYPDIKALLGMYAALGVILGHNFPFYLGFKGGKGIAATAGLYLSMDPVMTVIALVTFGVSVGISRFVSLGSILISLEFPIGVIILGEMGKWGLNRANLWEMYVVAVFLSGMAIYRHRENMKRIANGTERKIGEKAK